MHSAGIQAMGVLMDRIVPRIDRDKDFEQNIVVALKLANLIVLGLKVSGMG